MSKSRSRLVAAGALLCFAAGQAASAKAPTQGHDPQQAELLRELPVHVVMLNDRLRSQVAYQYTDFTMLNPNLLSMGVLPSVLVSGLMNASAQDDARDLVRPAAAMLHAAHCDLSQTDVVQNVVARTVKQTSWGASIELNAHAIASDQAYPELIPQAPRYEINVSYSFLPDHSAVVTSLNALAYSPDLPGGERNWKKHPRWLDQLVVISDLMVVPPKTEGDIEIAVAAEKARFARTEGPELIRQANAGDRKARRKAVPLSARHSRFMKEARDDTWTPGQLAAQRARLWSADDCALLRGTLASNAHELEQMLGMLFRGELPPRMDDAPKEPQILEVGERRVIAQPGGMYVMTRGEAVPLAFRYSWLPDPEA